VNACGRAISDLECVALERSLTDTSISVVKNRGQIACDAHECQAVASSAVRPRSQWLGTMDSFEPTNPIPFGMVPSRRML